MAIMNKLILPNHTAEALTLDYLQPLIYWAATTVDKVIGIKVGAAPTV